MIRKQKIQVALASGVLNGQYTCVDALHVPYSPNHNGKQESQGVCDQLTLSVTIPEDVNFLTF